MIKKKPLNFEISNIDQNKKGIRKKIFPPKWTYLKPPYQVGKDHFTYKDLQTDLDGWVDQTTARPFPYDLVFMRTQEKTKPGWWTGNKWEGFRLKEGERVLYWKMHTESRDG